MCNFATREPFYDPINPCRNKQTQNWIERGANSEIFPSAATINPSHCDRKLAIKMAFYWRMKNRLGQNFWCSNLIKTLLRIFCGRRMSNNNKCVSIFVRRWCSIFVHCSAVACASIVLNRMRSAWSRMESWRWSRIWFRYLNCNNNSPHTPLIRSQWIACAHNFTLKLYGRTMNTWQLQSQYNIFYELVEWTHNSV